MQQEGLPAFLVEFDFYQWLKQLNEKDELHQHVGIKKPEFETILSELSTRGTVDKRETYL